MDKLTRRDTKMPWDNVKEWQPFKIDALGLVTLLGADEVNQSIGTLQRRNFTECLPLLAAFIIAGDNFTDEKAGFALYNISDGIFTTELKGWFSRWLMSQDVQGGTTVFRFKVVPGANKYGGEKTVAQIISFIAVAPLLACTIAIGDWFGVGNSLAIIFSILVRLHLLWQRRLALEKMATPENVVADAQKVVEEKRMDFTAQSEKTDAPAKEFYSETLDVDTKGSLTRKKIFVTRQDGKMVTLYAPPSVLSTFTRDAELPNAKVYRFVQWIGWAAFGAHICILGMSTLFTQIYTVILLVFSTWALVHEFDSDIGRRTVCPPKVNSEGKTTESEILEIPFGPNCVVEQINPPTANKMDRRLWGYLRADPNPSQEKMLKHWSLLPFEDNKKWYKEYYTIRKDCGQTIPEGQEVEEKVEKSTVEPKTAT